jgi:hypothetical protein
VTAGSVDDQLVSGGADDEWSSWEDHWRSSGG